MEEFQEADQVDHPGLKGRVREIAASKIVEPFLFEQQALGQGKVTDHRGNLSSETDCIIYSTRHMPALMYEEKLGIFPIEAVLATIEVKSKLNRSELKDALEKASSLWRLDPFRKRFVEKDGAREELFDPPTLAVLAFSSDLSEDGKTEIERYFELDKEAATAPTVHFLCVIGRGLWFYKYKHRGALGSWVACPATKGYDEVIAFIAVMTASIAETARARSTPVLQPYLTRFRLS